MGLFSLLVNNPIAFFIIAIPLMYAIIFHELAHGWVAYRLGDSTAKDLGRLSLNPLRHLDPLGTLMLFIVGFGWAKPVPVNFSRIQDFRKGMILVSSAGIVANIILAFIALFLYSLLALPESSMSGLLLYFFAKINIILAAFNLIPVPPLDGSKILLGFAPQNVQVFLVRLERFGFLIVIGLLYLGVLDPVIDFLQRLILSIIQLLLP
ncbi:MAG: site-2 protease family protein [Desulfobacteraceae bacterium]|nr:MAG: site-2 protease family protein [Desulfobacteraceae bacterium]